MRLHKYTTYHWDDHRSDLAIYVANIYYRNSTYTKAKVRIYNKRNGIDYGTASIKLIHDRIKHWTKLEE